MELRQLDQSRPPEVKQSLPNFDAASPMTDGQLRKHKSEHTRQSFQGNKRRRLTRTDINFCLDFLLLLIFVALCTCSVIVDFVFPIGTNANGWSLWTQSYASWSRIRFWILAALAVAILIHVMLHWSWVCGVIAGRLGKKGKSVAVPDDPSRTLWGVGLLIFLINVIGMVIAAAVLSIHAPSAEP